MSNKFFLTVEDQHNAEHRLEYRLADNPIAQQWIKKIKHIHKVPFDRVYSTPNTKIATKEEINFEISADITLLNGLVGNVCAVKDQYNQSDCNLLHAFTISNQYGHTIEVRDIFHQLHRKIHQLEMALSLSDNSWLPCEWGEKGGPITTMHNESPYQYYQLNMLAGHIYCQWSEFGKTPYRYWKDRDLDEVDHFLANCKPHVTFRPNFSVFIKDVDYNYVDPEFEAWFARYRQAWEEKYSADKLSVYGHGGVLLAEPADNQFDDWSQLYLIKSINLA
jgi:hypothetical protein